MELCVRLPEALGQQTSFKLIFTLEKIQHNLVFLI